MNKYPYLILKNTVTKKGKYIPKTRNIPENNLITTNEEDTDINEQISNERRNSLSNSILKFQNDRETRRETRLKNLNIPKHIEYIEVQFNSVFTSTLEKTFRENYGLSPLRYDKFNTYILFGIAQNDKFNNFVGVIKNIVNKVPESLLLNKEILKIENFRFLSSEIIKQNFNQTEQLVCFELLSSLEINTDGIIDSLRPFKIKTHINI